MRDRHQLVLRMREEEGATYQVIGDALGVTQGRASAIYKRALVVRDEERVGMGTHAISVVRHYRGSLDELAELASRDPRAAVLQLISQPYCLRRHALQVLAWLAAGNRELPRSDKWDSGREPGH